MGRQVTLTIPDTIYDKAERIAQKNQRDVKDVLIEFIVRGEKWYTVIDAYLAEEINLGKAAELLGLHELELRQRFHKLGIPVRVGPSSLAEAQAEVETINSWFSD